MYRGSVEGVCDVSMLGLGEKVVCEVSMADREELNKIYIRCHQQNMGGGWRNHIATLVKSR